MRSREIPLTEWPEFAEQLNRQQQGQQVSLFAERRSGVRDAIARDVIFRGLAVDTEVGQQSVVVTVDANGNRHLSHTISKPALIVVDGPAVRVNSALGTGFTIEFARLKEETMNPLSDWGFDVEKFEAKARHSIQGAKGDLSEITGVLREALTRTKQTLIDLQTSGEPVATELKNGFERAWQEIEQAFTRARKTLRESRKPAGSREGGDDWLG